MIRKLVILWLAAMLLLPAFPGAAEESRVFEIGDEITLDRRGYAVVRWEDSWDRGPYTVLYRYAGAEGEAAQTLWRDGKDVAEKTYAIRGLIPGKTYRVIVWDRDGQAAGKTLTLPEKPAVVYTRKRNISLTPKYKTASTVLPRDAKALRTMSAQAMEKHMAQDGYLYGVDYRAEFPYRASRDVVHDAVFAFYAPNGFVSTDFTDDFTLPAQARGVCWYPFLGGSFFARLLEETGGIPVGTYRFEVYLEGRLFYEDAFAVSP